MHVSWAWTPVWRRSGSRWFAATTARPSSSGRGPSARRPTCRRPAGSGLVAAAVRAAIAEHRPAAVSIERVAWNRNQVSALQVARATGAVMVVAAEAGLPVEEYGPNEVKIAVTGAGNAGKREVQSALVRLHGLRGVPSQPDAADAVAVALTHLVGARMRALSRVGAR